MKAKTEKAKNAWRMAPEETKVTVTQNPYRMTVFIPFLPKITVNNSHGHWFTKWNIVKQTKALVGMYVSPYKPKAPLKKAKLILIRYSMREPDYDNLVSSFKPVVDALTEYGLIENDKPSTIGKSDYTWVRAVKKYQGISIVVEEVVGDESGGRA